MKNIRKYIYYLVGIIILVVQLLTNTLDKNNKNKTIEDNMDKVTVNFIDIGQGDAALVITASGKTMLIDAGDNSEEEYIVQYIKDQGITKLDYVVGTHPHADHIGGLDAVIRNFDIGNIYMPQKSHTTKTFKDVLLAIKDKGYTVKTAKAGVEFELEPGVKIQMVAPISEGYDEINDYSAVIRLSYGDISFLFTGDAEKVSENEILQSEVDINSTVLKVGHHGSKTSTTEEFLSAVNPQYAVISSKQDNDYGHPHKETIKKLEESNIIYYNTETNGSITAITDGKTIQWVTEGSSRYSK